MPNNDKSLDILGVKPIAEAVKTVTKGSVEGAGAFLSRICLPAAEEFGLLLRDRVSGWRAANAVKITQKAEAKTSARSSGGNLHAHPRLVMMAIEDGSWADCDEVQDMWAGLLSSSCTESGKSEDNLLFMNMLRQLTSLQARVQNYAVENCKKYSSGNFVFAEPMIIDSKEFISMFSARSLHDADVQMDQLRALLLVENGGGFHPVEDQFCMWPSSLAINFYVRCQGYIGAANEYFKDLPLKTPDQISEMETFLEENGITLPGE